MAGVIKELTQVLHTQGWVQDVLPFYNAALTREYLSSTATDGGLAFPHARSNSDDRLRFAFGRSPQPVAWGAPRTTAVRFVFVVVAPVTDTSRYLHLLSGLARLAKTESLLTELIGAQTSAQLLAGTGQNPTAPVRSPTMRRVVRLLHPIRPLAFALTFRAKTDAIGYALNQTDNARYDSEKIQRRNHRLRLG